MADNPIDINSIPFGNIIGGPLAACVEAQADAAQTTHNYINETLMNESDLSPGSMNPKTISFTFVIDGVTNKMVVPLLTIVPIPFMHIETVDLSFSAEVTENSEKKMLAKYTSPQVQSDSEENTTTEFRSLINIDIHATTSDVPSGVAKLLDVFSNQLITVEKLTPERIDTMKWEKMAASNSNINGRALDDLRGITSETIMKLIAANIKTVGEFLKAGIDPAGRSNLSKITKLSTKEITALCNNADILRLEGVDPNLAKLLKDSGVDSIKALKSHNANRLHEQMVIINNKKHYVDKVPSIYEVERLIRMAKTFDGNLVY